MLICKFRKNYARKPIYKLGIILLILPGFYGLCMKKIIIEGYKKTEE